VYGVGMDAGTICQHVYPPDTSVTTDLRIDIMIFTSYPTCAFKDHAVSFLHRMLLVRLIFAPFCFKSPYQQGHADYQCDADRPNGNGYYVRPSHHRTQCIQCRKWYPSPDHAMPNSRQQVTITTVLRRIMPVLSASAGRTAIHGSSTDSVPALRDVSRCATCPWA